MTDNTTVPYARAAFINAIQEEGTKQEACDWLQTTWNERCALAARVAELENLYAETADHMEKGWTYARRVEAERDAARAKVARLRGALTEIQAIAQGYEYSYETADHGQIDDICRAAMQEGEG